MTIEVKIKNMDSRDRAIVKVATIDKYGQEQGMKMTLSNLFRPQEILKGGEETDEHTFYVHDGQSVVITEVQNG